MSDSTGGSDETPEEVKKPDRGKRILAIIVILFVFWMLVEIFAISLLGTNANATFEKVGGGRATGR